MTSVSLRNWLGLLSLALALVACGAPNAMPQQVVVPSAQATTTATSSPTTAPTTQAPTLVPTLQSTTSATDTTTATTIPTNTATNAATTADITATTVVFDTATATITATGTAVPSPTASTLPATPTDVPPTAQSTPTPAPRVKATATTGAKPVAVVQNTGGLAQGPLLPRGSITRRPWMVMIDNHPDAYPQSGMDKAAVVFEGLAEYGISRYIATFADGWTPDAAQIGPIRSTRYYFAEWAMAFHPLYVHAGGSPDGLALVQSTNQLINFDALNQPTGSYRDNSRLAPHNLYTSSALLRQFAAKQGISGSDDANVGYLYAKPAPLAQPQATTLNYYFLDQNSAAGFVYSPAQNVYYRNVFGHADIDRITGAQLWTNNVVVMAVTGARRTNDEKARIDQNVVGSGPARIFKDGGLINATWVKNSAAGPLRFYDAAGNEIVFSSGSLWIAAIPSLDRLSIQ
ncbi:MAG: DUF3048 domain-containing protein [Herpetosiphonaceae bacterium]|nr:DUF3048 domain-containing protein [Herpetosiphonaceae bacterium]